MQYYTVGFTYIAGKGKTTKNTGGGHLGQNLAAAAASTGTSITGHLQTSIRKAGTLKKYAGVIGFMRSTRWN